MVIENVQRRNTAVAGDAEQPIYLSDARITNLAVDVGIFCVQIVENLSLHQCSKKSIPALIIEAPFPVGPYLALLVFGEWLDLNLGSILRREIKQNRFGNCLFGKWEAYLLGNTAAFPGPVGRAPKRRNQVRVNVRRVNNWHRRVNPFATAGETALELNLWRRAAWI